MKHNVKFYRDVFIIKPCKKCGVKFKMRSNNFFVRLGVCWNCRRILYKEWYQDWKIWFNSLPPERKVETKKQRYKIWRKWVSDHINRRRLQALASYHKNKLKHKGRIHRRTRPTQKDLLF